MKRRDFLRKLFGIGAAVAVSKVPVLAKDKPETFKIEDMFEQHEGNNQLYYLKKDSWLNKELANVLGDRYVDRKWFRCYSPQYSLSIPIKDEYTKADFQQIIMFPKIDYHKRDYFCGENIRGTEYGLVKLFRDDKNGYYVVEFFDARKPE